MKTKIMALVFAGMLAMSMFAGTALAEKPADAGCKGVGSFVSSVTPVGEFKSGVAQGDPGAVAAVIETLRSC